MKGLPFFQNHSIKFFILLPCRKRDTNKLFSKGGLILFLKGFDRLIQFLLADFSNHVMAVE